MSTRKTNVPAIPSIGRSPNEVDSALKSLKEATEVGYGRRGDPLDRFVTVRDLKDAGLAGTAIAGGAVTITAPPDTGTGPGGAPIFDPGDPDFGDNDYTPPPAPKNVQVHHIAPSGLMVTWDPPDYSNHSFAEVFRMPPNANGTPPTFNIAASGFDPTKPVGPGNVHPNFAGRANGTIFTDADLTRIDVPGQTPLDAALNPTTYYYWVRFVSTAVVVGPYAPLANQGAAGQLSIDPALVLGQLISNVQNTPTYRQLVGQFFDTSSFDPIMQAGGVTNYIASLDDALHGQINQQLIRIIGVADNTNGSPTVIARLSTVEGIAASDHANLSEVNSWQAALSLAAGANSGGAQYGVFAYTKTSDLPSQVALQLAQVADASHFSAGMSATIVAPGSSPLASIAGTHTISSTAGTLLFFNLPGNTVPVGGGVLVTGVTVGPASGGASSDPDAFVDLIASIFHNVYVSVDPSTAIGTELAALSTSIGSVSTEVQQLSSSVTNIDGTLSASWTVRMREITQGGLVYAAGFGLGLDTTLNEDGTFSTLSTFLVNADQFAVMGTGAAGGIITNISASGANATITLGTAQHGITAGAANAVFSVTDGNPGGTSPNPLSSMGLAGKTVDVTAVNGANITVHRTDNGSFTSASNLAVYKNALMPSTSIPFIIDTTRNVVGIRGKLIVDGLVRATEGDFDTLTATTAFIQNLQAEIVNANVVIGQRIIAGTPGSGALDPSSYNSISNFIVEMNNPTVSDFPFRYWKPSTGQMVFGLDRNANLFVGGNLSVGDNATIATTGEAIMSIGGAGADGDGSQYPLWIGPRSAYGTNGFGRTEANGIFYVRELPNGKSRAGFNTDARGDDPSQTRIFLGDSGLMLPALTGNNTAGSAWGPGPGDANPRASSIVQSAVSGERVTIRETRSGGMAKTLIIVCGNIATQSTGGNDHKGYLMKATLTGSNANAGYDANDGTTIIEHVVDDFSAEVWPFTMMGVVQVPAGNYYVRLNIKTVAEAPFSIIRGWNVIAMQVQ